MDLVPFLVTQCLNALSQAALLFFLGVGLTLIFGIMRIVNFAHGTFYMLGAFIGFSVARYSGGFWAALIIAPLITGAIGTAFETGLLRHLYRRDASAFLMVTFGITLVMAEVVRLLWGVQALQVSLPPILSGIVFIFDEPFPIYRLFLIGAGTVVAIAIWQFLERTRMGLLIRATSQNAEMVHALGVNVVFVRSGIFGIGCGLAALGGVLAAPMITASLGMAANAIVDAFVIVIIGGMGSFLGSLLAAVLVAFVQVFGTYYFPDFAIAAMYLLMLLVLVIRPGGLLGKEA